MPPTGSGYTTVQETLQLPGRDSLELASLAEESEQNDGQVSDISSPSGIGSSRRESLEDEDPLNEDFLHRPRQTRAYSMTSTFDFAPAMFPLTSSGGGYSSLGAPADFTPTLERRGTENLEKHKTLTYLNGLSLVVGLIIGSGIFSSPSQVNSHTGSPGASLVVWTISGLLAWTGAASYAELGGAIPLNGGAQVYLAKIFGEMAGFLFTWCAILVLKPGSAAIIAIILGEYTVRAIIGAEVEDVNPWINKAPALLALISVTLLNCISTRFSSRVSDIFMFFKFVALLAITVIGIVVAATGFSFKGPANTDWKTQGWFDGTSRDVSDWAVALYAGLWAYDGWDNTNYVTGEFKNPNRDLPRVLHTAMPAVVVCYILANVSYYFVLPENVIDASNTVAVQFGSRVFGPAGALVLALMVGASAFGALNATTFTSGRLVYVAGREGYIPALFGRIGFGAAESGPAARFRKRTWFTKAAKAIFGSDTSLGFTPVNAMLLNAFLTAIYVVIGEFRTLITFYGVAGYSFYFFTVLGLIVLRIREPNLERPYKTWITTPVIFCCISLFLISRAIFAQPIQAAIVVAFVASGVPVYFWRVRGRDVDDGVSNLTGISRYAKQGAQEKNWRFWRRWGRS